ncbi:MAG: NAD(P)H-hydrate dehydratase [Sphingobium sp.]
MNGGAILTAAQMRAAEQALFATGVPEYDVMVRAGRAAADIIWRAGARRDALILCGPGNNGGDGYVIARTLRDHGVPVRVAAIAGPATPGARQARADWAGPVEDMLTAAPAHQMVDALFGTGLSRGLDGPLADRLADLAGAAAHRYAVDLPSGISTDDGALLSPVPHYDLCLSLGAWKRAHMLRPASLCWDRMLCLDIGIETPDAAVYRLARPRLQAPADDAHKYRRGLVAVVAGEMAGAAALAAQAAARGGAGYVRLIGAQAIVDAPHAIVRMSSRADGALEDDRIAAMLIGPGLGRSARSSEKLRAALERGRAMVLDADALWLMAEGAWPDPPPRAILTPHEGEFARLFPGMTDGTVIDRARAAAHRCGAVVVLKGPVSVIAAPDGRACVADRASSWLSTAGTGDVLAGLCASRLAVTGDPFAAACEAVWLHGEAARRAGPAFIADDLLHGIGGAIKACL